MKTQQDFPTLFEEEARAIISVKNGADVYAYGLAQTLRGIQRRGVPVDELKSIPKRRMDGAILQITKPMMYTGNGTDRMPYFGAIATPQGIKAARWNLENIKALKNHARSFAQVAP